MFGSSNDFIPRTYSIKSFKQRKSIKLRKLLAYFIYIIIALAILGFGFLSFNKLI